MKKLLLLPTITLLFVFQGCSWNIGFYIANTTNDALTVDAPGSFPIFHYPNVYYDKPRQFKMKNNESVDVEKVCDAKSDTLEKYSHYTVQVPPHTAVEIGQLQNDNYEKHDQYFINGRVFNLEKICVSVRQDGRAPSSSGDKKIEIVPSTFDNYFHKGKDGGVYFVI